jgi:hypothetical protein
MFKKKCSNCNKKIERDFDFCPYCSSPTKDHKKEYGLLGKDDNTINPTMIPKIPEMTNNSLLDRLIGSAFSTAIKMVEKEMHSIENQPKMNIPENLQLYINGKKISLPSQKNSNLIKQPLKEVEQEFDEEGNPVKIVKEVPKISEETLKKSARLPRKEAKTKLTRLKDKVVYELETPGISSLSNIVINKLEQSIEIKAYTEKAVFIKNIAIKLPLASYSVRGDKLFLEFKT